MEAVPTQQGCGSGGNLGHEWDLLEQEVGTRAAAVCPHHCSRGGGGGSSLRSSVLCPLVTRSS